MLKGVKAFTMHQNERSRSPPCGFVYEERKHYRDYAEGNSLYNYQVELDKRIKELEKVDSAQEIPMHSHYLVTNYIKGGLFGQKKEQL